MQSTKHAVGSISAGNEPCPSVFTPTTQHSNVSASGKAVTQYDSQNEPETDRAMASTMSVLLSITMTAACSRGFFFFSFFEHTIYGN